MATRRIEHRCLAVRAPLRPHHGRTSRYSTLRWSGFSVMVQCPPRACEKAEDFHQKRNGGPTVGEAAGARAESYSSTNAMVSLVVSSECDYRSAWPTDTSRRSKSDGFDYFIVGFASLVWWRWILLWTTIPLLWWWSRPRAADRRYRPVVQAKDLISAQRSLPAHSVKIVQSGSQPILRFATVYVLGAREMSIGSRPRCRVRYRQ